MNGKIKLWRCKAHLYFFLSLDPVFFLYDSRVRPKILIIPSSSTKSFWSFLGNLYQPSELYMSDAVLESRKRYDVLITQKDTEIKKA